MSFLRTTTLGLSGGGGDKGPFEDLIGFATDAFQYIERALTGPLGTLALDFLERSGQKQVYDDWVAGTFEPWRAGEIDRLNQMIVSFGIPGFSPIPGGSMGPVELENQFGTGYLYRDATGQRFQTTAAEGGGPRDVPSDWTLIRGPNPSIFQQVTQATGESSERILGFFAPEAIAQRQSEAFGPIAEGMAQRTAEGRGASEDILGSAVDRFNRITAEGEGIVGGFEERQREGMSLLEGLGRQEEADIRQDFASLGGTLQQRLAAQGFGGSAAAGVASGVQRAQTGALGRLDERLREQQVTTFADLSGDVLGAREAQLIRSGEASMDVLSRMGINREFLARLSQEELTQLADIAQSSLDAQGAGLVAREGAALMPGQTAFGLGEFGADLQGQIESIPPSVPFEVAQPR